MAKALIVRVDTFLSQSAADGIREVILKQYNEGGVIVLDKGITCEAVEFDAVLVTDSSTKE